MLAGGIIGSIKSKLQSHTSNVKKNKQAMQGQKAPQPQHHPQQAENHHQHAPHKHRHSQLQHQAAEINQTHSIHPANNTQTITHVSSPQDNHVIQQQTPEATVHDQPSPTHTVAVANDNGETNAPGHLRQKPLLQMVQVAEHYHNEETFSPISPVSVSSTTDENEDDIDDEAKDIDSPAVIIFDDYSANSGISFDLQNDFEGDTEAKIHELLQEIEEELYQYDSRQSRCSDETKTQCEEWTLFFPHLRVTGKQILSPSEEGFEFYAPIIGSPLSAAAKTTEHDLIHRIESPFGGFEEETIAQDGYVEEYFARDGTISTVSQFATTEPSLDATSLSISSFQPGGPSQGFRVQDLSSFIMHQEQFYNDHQLATSVILGHQTKTKAEIRRERRYQKKGFPPIDPEFCLRSTVFSLLFDRIWYKITPLMRPLLVNLATQMAPTSHNSSHSRMTFQDEKDLVQDDPTNEEEIPTEEMMGLQHVENEGGEHEGHLQEEHVYVPEGPLAGYQRIEMRPSTVCTDQNIQFGLSNSISIRPYTILSPNSILAEDPVHNSIMAPTLNEDEDEVMVNSSDEEYYNDETPQSSHRTRLRRNGPRSSLDVSSLVESTQHKRNRQQATKSKKDKYKKKENQIQYFDDGVNKTNLHANKDKKKSSKRRRRRRRKTQKKKNDERTENHEEQNGNATEIPDDRVSGIESDFAVLNSGEENVILPFSSGGSRNISVHTHSQRKNNRRSTDSLTSDILDIASAANDSLRVSSIHLALNPKQQQHHHHSYNSNNNHNRSLTSSGSLNLTTSSKSSSNLPPIGTPSSQQQQQAHQYHLQQLQQHQQQQQQQRQQRPWSRGNAGGGPLPQNQRQMTDIKLPVLMSKPEVGTLARAQTALPMSMLMGNPRAAAAAAAAAGAVEAGRYHYKPRGAATKATKSLLEPGLDLWINRIGAPAWNQPTTTTMTNNRLQKPPNNANNNNSHNNNNNNGTRAHHHNMDRLTTAGGNNYDYHTHHNTNTTTTTTTTTATNHSPHHPPRRKPIEY